MLFIITRADAIGGAHLHVRDLCSRFIELGHTIRVVTGPHGPFSTMLERAGVPSQQCDVLQRSLHPIQDGRAVVALRSIIHEFEPDLVSMHSSKAGIVGRLACRASHVPCIFTAHGWSFTDGISEPQRTVYRSLEKLTAPLAERIICVSEYDRQIGIDAGISAARLTTIHNGMPDIPMRLRATPGRSGPVRIVMVARFDAQKDHHTLIHAFADLDDACLDLVGDGPTLEAAKVVVAEMGIASRVKFYGYTEDVAEILARAHVFALASNWEGFPLSTLEAMRAGLPTVVSAVGGASEAVSEGITGYSVPRSDVTALRDRLSILVADSQKRVQFGNAARLRYLEYFTLDRMFDRTLALCDDVVTGQSTRNLRSDVLVKAKKRPIM